MKIFSTSFLLLACSIGLAEANDFMPLGPSASTQGNELGIRVVQFVDILPEPGSQMRCLKSDRKFGYLVTRESESDYIIDVISNGELEGEKSRRKAVVKESGSPFLLYLSVFNRYGDYGTYFELILDKKLNSFYGSLVGDAMYTEAYYSKEGEKEKESFKPIWKERLQCSMDEN